MAEDIQTHEDEDTTGISQEVGEDSESSSDELKEKSSTAWIGSLKRKHREKGYNEGYAKAIAELSNEANNDSSNKVTQEKTSSLNIDQVKEEVLRDINSRNLSDRYAKVGALGAAKYSDFEAKVSSYLEEASNKAEKNDNDMNALLSLTATVGDEDTVYKVVSDENFRESLLNKNPKNWVKYLAIKNSSQEKASDREPIKKLSTSAGFSSGEKKLTWEERKAKCLENTLSHENN